MAIKQQRPTPSVEAPQTETEQATEAVQSSTGPRYTIARGDTLSGISKRAYGSAGHWRCIMDANPDKVFKGGNLIMVGDELKMPSIGHFPPTDYLDDFFAMEPERFVSPYGKYLVLPEGYEGQPDPIPGWTIVKAAHFQALEDARIEEAEENAEAALKSIEKLLSYSMFDWVITDQNAIDAMTLAAALPVPQRQATLSSLSLDFVKRLLDNIPGDAKNSVAYARLLVGFGPQYATSRLNELQVMFLAGKGEDALEGLPLEHIDVLVAALPDGGKLSEWQEAMLHSVFLSLPDSDLARLDSLFEKRFDMELKAFEPSKGDTAIGVDWDAPQIRRLWTVLMHLPEADVENNESIDSMERYNQPGESGGGWFWGYKDQIAMGFETSEINDTVTWQEEGDAVQGDVYFDHALRHEVGHAVDDRDGIMKSAMGNDICGAWKVGLKAEEVAKIWLGASTGDVGSLTGAESDAALKVLVECMENESYIDFGPDIAALPFWGDKGKAGQQRATKDPVYKQLEYALTSPWYGQFKKDPHVGGRVYQVSQGGWVSYKIKAKDYRVSSYQWRAPGEWFADVYATYYDPKSPRGSQLNPNLKKWFEKRVPTPSEPG